MKKRVLIVTVPKQDIVRPPGILSILASCCKEADHDYDIFDLNLLMYNSLDQNLVKSIDVDFTNNKFSNPEHETQYLNICKKLQDKIESYQPDVVAISVFTYCSILSTYTLIDYLKTFPGRQNYKIVLGGLGLNDPDPLFKTNNNFGDYCLMNNLADYAIFGEGEFAFIELLRGNTEYPGINQIPPKQIMDLNTLPVPDYEKVNPQNYYYSNEPELLVNRSRGCVRSCSFCDVGHY